MRGILTILISLSILFSATGQDVPFYAQPIQADGILEEEIWKQIPVFNQFSNFYPINEGNAVMDTEVKVFQDGKYLNVAFVYHDSIAAVRVNSLKRDDYTAGFHLSDCVGIVIDPYNDQNRGYFFAVNGLGAQLDALIAEYDDLNLSWDAIWESGQSTQGTDKIYELKIPLSSFSYEADVSQWSFQFYTRDSKDRMYTVWNKFQRGFLQFDTRFLKRLEVEQLQPSKAARTMLIPALTINHLEDLEEKVLTTRFQPSLDIQYKVSDGLRIDATLNPDFSQIDVDQQVTNLTRFNIVFPERRNFFIENSDLFTSLGAADNINPFFSRFIGASQDILFGLKLSGNISSKTRIGLLNVQSKLGEEAHTQNYTVAVVKQQLSPYFFLTGYLVNRDAIDGWEMAQDFNRVAGIKGNYLSKNRRWSGFATYSHSFNNGDSSKGHVFSIENNYNTRTLSFSSKLTTVGRNYLTDIGFVPRIYNYDAINDITIREGYTQLSQSVQYNLFPKNQSVVQSIRVPLISVDAYLDEEGDLFETNLFYNSAIFFSNLMSAYVNLYHDEIQLKYAFDPLRNGQFILPDDYQNNSVRIGFNSDYTRAFYGSVNAQWGSFFEGTRRRFGTKVGYRFLPVLSLELNYEYNTFRFDDVGEQTLQLVGLKKEVFFSNKLNWTTYMQYNEQIDNINFNSRIQWEYKPLSFLFLVFSDNYDDRLGRKNWSVAMKLNRRLQF